MSEVGARRMGIEPHQTASKRFGTKTQEQDKDTHTHKHTHRRGAEGRQRTEGRHCQRLMKKYLRGLRRSLVKAGFFFVGLFCCLGRGRDEGRRDLKKEHLGESAHEHRKHLVSPLFSFLSFGVPVQQHKEHNNMMHQTSSHQSHTAPHHTTPHPTSTCA
jgi:hypothetical protein